MARTRSAPERVIHEQTALIRELLRRAAARRPDMRTVHRLRIASRRVRAALEFVDPQQTGDVGRLRKSAQRLGRRLGRVRMADVSIRELRRAAVDPAGKTAATGVIRSLRSRQRRAMSELEKLLTRRQFRKRIDRLARVRVPGSDTKRAAVASAQARVVGVRRRRCLASLNSPTFPEAFHTFRIAVKRLRYVLEVLSRDRPEAYAGRIDRLKKIQDAIGELHDCQVALAELRRYCETRLTDRRTGEDESVRRGLSSLRRTLRARERRLLTRAVRTVRAFRDGQAQPQRS